MDTENCRNSSLQVLSKVLYLVWWYVNDKDYDLVGKVVDVNGSGRQRWSPRSSECTLLVLVLVRHLMKGKTGKFMYHILSHASVPSV